MEPLMRENSEEIEEEKVVIHQRSLSKRHTLILIGAVISACLLGTFTFWIINGRTFSIHSEEEPSLPEDCKNIPDSEKFDCHPDRPITENECLKRGCCYSPASDLGVSDFDLITSSYLGVPSCYFPKDYNGYSFTLTKNNSWVLQGELTRNISSGFVKDSHKVLLYVTYIDDKNLRLELKDEDPERYVSNLPLFHNVTGAQNPLYELQIDNNGFLTICRRSTGVCVFKTRLSQLIYSQQFLQLSSYTASSYLYGLGEHKDKLLRSFNWNRYTLFNQGDIPVPHRNLYGTHPFCLVMEPDGKANGIFFRANAAIDILLQPAPAITFRTIGGIFDFLIMLGPTPQEVVSQYNYIVGRPFFIPYWSLGFHLSRYGYFSLSKANETLQRNLRAGVPVDVMWNDIDYMARNLDFTYDPVAFKDLPKWIDELHKKEMHYVAMISPGISNAEENGTYPAFDEGKKLDLFVKDADGNYIESKVKNTNYSVFPDFTFPKTQGYWTDRLKEFYEKVKFDGLWLGMNEPLNFENGSSKGCPESSIENPKYLPGRPYPLRTLTICMTAKHYFSLHYYEHNLVGFRESYTTYASLQAIRKKRPFILSRATYSGQGAHSGHWSGDMASSWEDLRYTIPFMLVFNIYGMPMVGSDICGFYQNTSPELCARWQTLGAFYPFVRNHNDYDTIAQDPAAMGGDVLIATKKSLNTRYYLLPYIYDLFYRSAEFGEATVRPLFFEFPTDRIALSMDEEFLWGPALLVLPALYPGITEVKAYLPNAIWYDFYTGSLITNKAEYITLPSNITHINLAVRGGYVLPLQLPGENIIASRENDFDILVVLDEKQEASGEFYWDDGDSLGTHQTKAYDKNLFSADKNCFNNTVIWYNYPTKLDLNEIKVYGLEKKPNKVAINDKGVQFQYLKATLSITAKGFSLNETFTVIWD